MEDPWHDYSILFSEPELINGIADLVYMRVQCESGFEETKCEVID